MPKPILDWQKFAIDRKTIKKSTFEFNQWLSSDGGRLKLDDWILNDSDYPIDGEIGIPYGRNKNA